MAAAAALRWESMKPFDPAGFAKFDPVKDDICPINLSPTEQQKFRDFALARVKNNALLALRWRPKAPTRAQSDACHHGVCRFMSDFEIDTRILYHSKRNKGLSLLEMLHPILVHSINLYLDEVDSYFWNSSFEAYDTDDDERIYDWFELAMRLKDSISERLQFCYHCLIFLPKASFCYPVAGIDALVCLDCLRLVELQCLDGAEDCDGCEILHYSGN